MDTLSIVAEPFVFTQQRPLLPGQFLSEARQSGLHLSEQELEAFHRVRLLVPFYRVAREGREIAAAHRRGEDAYHLAHWQPTAPADLVESAKAGLLHDPATEPFIARRRLKRSIADWSYESSVYLYSRHQLVAVQLLRQARPQLRLRRFRGDLVGRLDADQQLTTLWRERATLLRETALLATLLEPAYQSRIVRRFSLPHEADFAAFDRWRRRRPLLHPLRLLGVDAAWIKDAAAGLHSEADRIDPLGDWAEIIAAGEPQKWNSLRGDARGALELRLTAELLLLYYDDLHRARRAPALPEAPPRTRGVFDNRLKRRRSLNSLLTDFDLSPHPHLVLAVEGATELSLFPRAMKLLGLPTDDDFIAIEDAGGVDRDLTPLVAYAVAPRVLVDSAEAVGGRYVRLQRPPTRLLVVFDAEGHFATAADRRARRELWVDRLMQTLPAEFQTPVVRDQLARLVTVATWTSTGTSFEFAHFTDSEIATASAGLDRRALQPSMAERLSVIAKLRAAHGNLDQLLGPISKVALANELWPMLAAKIDRALERGTERRIPIVRVIDQAAALANELPRRNLVIALEPQPRRRR